MKSKRNHPYLFQLIAPVYGWFYGSQKRNFIKEIPIIMEQSIIKEGQTILDVGCGTGALSSALSEFGCSVTGIDPVAGMLKVARKKDKNQTVNYIVGNVLDGLDMEDNIYDISVASHVAHGLKKRNRLIMYQEMKRVTKDKVLFIDYNQTRNVFVSLIEWFEGGDYFNFIKEAPKELEEIFGNVTVIPLHHYVSLYICEL